MVTKTKAYAEIKAHIDKQRGPYHSWYAGITGDIEQRLFIEHGVPRQNYWFIYRECPSADDAREVEAALLQLGCKGGIGGGDDDCRFVYAYLIGQQTKE